MHGIVHKHLETYVIERTDAEWESILDRADVEPTLYLPVSTYDDREVDAILGATASATDRERRAIEREFGRALAPELLSTFDAHLRADRDRALFDRVEDLESVLADVAASTHGTALPAVATRCDSTDRIDVTYETQRETVYCGLALGLLEGLVDAADADATVTETACALEDADTDSCSFRVERD